MTDLADDLVEEWHELPEDGVKLHEHMKLSSDEYKAWVEKNVLPDDFEERHGKA